MMGSVIINKSKCYFLNIRGRKGRLYTGYLLIVQLNVHNFVVKERNNIHSVNWRPPPLFLDETEARRAEKFFVRLPPLVSGSGWPPPPDPLSPHPLSEGLDPSLPTSNFIWGAPPENLNWHVVCLLTSFQGETATFSWLFIAVEQTGLRLFAIPNQCATPVHECWLRTDFIESPTAQAVIREEPFDYQVFVEMRICWRSPKRQWTDWGTEQNLKA